MIHHLIKNPLARQYPLRKSWVSFAVVSALFISSCAQITGPDTRNVNIPSPQFAQERKQAINERPDAISYLPLGKDVLTPEAHASSPLPKKIVGPFELRGETLGGALQLILDGTDMPIAFEATQGLDRPITITNLKGEIGTVVTRVCSLADLYCSYENGILIVKETQLFTITIPPVGDSDTFLTNVSGAIEEIVGSPTITDNSTRTIVYRASHRTAEVAESYFQRLRANTALIIFETYIWEVSLNSGNSTGIDWNSIETFGKFNVGVDLAGVTNPSLGTPVSIGLPTLDGGAIDGDKVFQFISEYGAVKTISQPQVTVLSGSSARFRVADTQNYVSEITRSVSGTTGTISVSTTTDSVDTGFTFDIASNWDNATVYGDIDILLQEVRSIDTFDDNPDAIVQLPQTTERELSTQVRIRPGDSLLIAGLVREIDNFSKEGPGIQEPIFPSSRVAQTSNVELVFLLRPRVVVYVNPTDEEFKKLQEESQKDLQESAQNFIKKINMEQKSPIEITPPAPVFDPVTIQDSEEVKEEESLEVSKKSNYIPLQPIFKN